MCSNIHFQTLPAELQHHKVLNLHPSAATALKQTNRYLYAYLFADPILSKSSSTSMRLNSGHGIAKNMPVHMPSDETDDYISCFPIWREDE